MLFEVVYQPELGWATEQVEADRMTTESQDTVLVLRRDVPFMFTVREVVVRRLRAGQVLHCRVRPGPPIDPGNLRTADRDGPVC